MNDLAQTIADAQFPLVRRGYDPAAVAAFLAELAQQAQALQSSDRVAEAERQVEAANRYLEDLRVQAAALEAQIQDGARERAVLTSDALAHANREAEGIVAKAHQEAEEVYRHRWREAGELVTRILETADVEADRLRQGAEAMALEIRTSLKTEVGRVRAEAERHAIEVRSGAEEFAAARLASVESEREQALESAEAARVEAERVEREAKARADELTRRAEERVRSHVTEQLNAARQQLERLRSDEVAVSGRLLRVQELVTATLEIAGEGSGPSLGEASGLLLQLTDPDDEPGEDDLVPPTNIRPA